MWPNPQEIAYLATFTEELFNPLQDGEEGGGGGKKVPATSFSRVTSTNIGFDP